MSSYAENVARWNAIPMSRESSLNATAKKRSRSRSSSPPPVVKFQGDYDSSDEDDVSLVSRSPSPNPDMMDVTAYDQYHPAPEREVVTVETRIKSTNKGYSILAKLGWTAGQPLGLSGEGRVDPIPFSVKNDVTGLGKYTQDERMIETTVSQRRGLDSERQIKETMEQRQSREQKAAEKEALANQIAITLKSFYCTLCDKQYQTVAQYDEHTNSYAHHHKQRFKDMQANAKGLGGGKQDKEARLAKERKREEKELKRMAKAQGVKVNTLGGVLGVTSTSAVTNEESKGFKKSGWATVSTSIQPTQVQSLDASSPAEPDRATVSSTRQSFLPTGVVSRTANPGFRTGGYETLETTSRDSDSGQSGAIVNPQSTQPRSRWVSVATAQPFLPPPPPPSRSLEPLPPPPPSGLPPPPPPLPHHFNSRPPSFSSTERPSRFDGVPSEGRSYTDSHQRVERNIIRDQGDWRYAERR